MVESGDHRGFFQLCDCMASGKAPGGAGELSLLKFFGNLSSECLCIGQTGLPNQGLCQQWGSENFGPWLPQTRATAGRGMRSRPKSAA